MDASISVISNINVASCRVLHTNCYTYANFSISGAILNYVSNLTRRFNKRCSHEKVRYARLIAHR